MSFHLIVATTKEKNQIVKHITDLLFDKGCLYTSGKSLKEDVLTLKVSSDKNRVFLQSSDPFFTETKLFSSPNDFFLPFSEVCNSNYLFIVELDEEDTLQFWIFQNGSCVDQYHSAWKSFPTEKQKEGVAGNPEILEQVFPAHNRENWKKWLVSDASASEKLEQLKKLIQLPDNIFHDLTEEEQESTILNFRVPPKQQEVPKHLFPWIAIAAPAVYATLRYRIHPELKPSPYTPSDNENLPVMHTYLQEKGFDYFGDYILNIMREVVTFLRLYYRSSDCTHISVSRTQTPVDVTWQTEISNHFIDETSITTTNSAVNVPFSIPYRIIYWKPEISQIKDMLEYHLDIIKRNYSNKTVKVYSENTYLEDIQAEIQKDFTTLQEMGLLRPRSHNTYGLTWKGTFQMLYRQWKSALRKESTAS